MKTIYKYTIGITPEIAAGINLEEKIYVPAGSKILCCKVQNKTDVCVWVELEESELSNPKETLQPITFKIFGTGWNMDFHLKDKNYEYIDTFMIGDGVFVYHVYAIYE